MVEKKKAKFITAFYLLKFGTKTASYATTRILDGTSRRSVFMHFVIWTATDVCVFCTKGKNWGERERVKI